MRRQHATEAGAVAEPVASRYRTWPYDHLVEELLDKPTIAEVAGKTDASYQVEVEGFWDSGRPGDLGVTVAMDDAGFSAFRPLTVGFIVRPDSTFVGRRSSSRIVPYSSWNGDRFTVVKRRSQPSSAPVRRAETSP